MKRIVTAVLFASAFAGCTMVNSVALPARGTTAEPFVTAGDLAEPHEVIGLVQVTRTGVLLFGNLDVVGTDLEAGFKQALLPAIKEAGGDGAVRVRYQMTQYAPAARVIGAILFFIPLPSSVTITGQVVKLKGAAAAPVQ
ncbi:MAG: hypothetical protein RL653_3476 [Pseudomonadota bacterium]|jgi:hypothetical protein